MMQKKVAEILPIQAMKSPTLTTPRPPLPPALTTPPPPLPPALTTPPPPPQGQMEPMFIALVYLLSLPWAFVYFFHITLFSLKIKISSMKNLINHQNDVICFKKNIYNK